MFFATSEALFENVGAQQEHAVTNSDDTKPEKRNDSSVAGLGLMLPHRPMLLPLFLVFGIPILGVLGILSYARSYSRRIKKPLTSVESLRKSSPFDSSTPRRVRLSGRGAVLALMSIAFGVVGLFVSSAVFYKIAIVGLTMENIPAVVMVLIIDCAVLVFPWLLLKDRKLIREGKFSAGVVVDARVGGIYSYAIVYDFLDHSGRIVRGGSLRRVFTANWTNWGVGSRVPIVYLIEDPSRNSLYASMAWTVDQAVPKTLL